MLNLNSITGANNVSETNNGILKKTHLTQSIKPINIQNSGDTFVQSKPKADKEVLFTGKRDQIQTKAYNTEQEEIRNDKNGKSRKQHEYEYELGGGRKWRYFVYN